MRSYTNSIKEIEKMRSYFGAIGEPWAQNVSNKISLALDGVMGLPGSTDCPGEIAYKSKTADRLAEATKKPDIDEIENIREEVTHYAKVVKETKGISPHTNP